MASIRSGIGDNVKDRYLFKAKRIDNGEWVQGALFNGESHCIIGQEIKFSPYTEHECKIVGHEVDRDTICQCTGLKDKNGKLIWENDIVGYYDKYGEKWCYGLVGYGEFNCSCCSGVYGWHFGYEDIREYQCYEVKGNKFDNPELLEVG